MFEKRRSNFNDHEIEIPRFVNEIKQVSTHFSSA